MSAAFFAPHPPPALMHAILGQNYGASQIFLQEDDGAARELFAGAARHGLVIRPVYMPAAFTASRAGESPRTSPVRTARSCIWK